MPVAIHGTVGNPPITDATATSSDVTSEKVFYNNDGRCIGSAQSLFPNAKSMHYFIPKNKTFKFNQNVPTYSPYVDAIGLVLPNFTSGGFIGFLERYSERFALIGAENVIGYSVNGSEPYMINTITNNAFLIGEEISYDTKDSLIFYLMENDGYIYIYGRNASSSSTYAPLTVKRDLNIIIYYK